MTRTRHPRTFVRSTLAFAISVALTSSYAQQSGSSAADSSLVDSSGGLQTIIVTAQKRKEKLQEVPIPVTAFDAAALEKTGAADMRDIASRTPGFTMTQFNVGEPSYSLRGVSSNSDSAAGEASVAVFVDEVFIGRPAGANFSFLDLERVEVLRGPQGTLFGRNTAGGALSVTTARPSQTPSTRVFASYGNYSAQELGLVVNRPLTDNVSARVSLGYRDRDGFSKHILTGASLDGGKNISGRGKLLINASDATTVLLSADFGSDRGEGLGRVPYPVLTTAGPNASIPVLYPAGTDKRLAYSDPTSFQNRDVYGLSARVDHDMTAGTLTSITAYRNTKLDQYEDLSGLPAPWVLVNKDRVKETAKQFSQEFRLASTTASGMKWVTGLYYFNESVVRDESFFTRFTLVPVAGGDVRFNQDVKNKSAAIFGQVDYPVAKDLNLSVGLRHTRDTKDADQAAFNLDPTDATPGIPLFPGQPYHIVASKTWDADTGKLGLDYRIDRDKMIYASVARGYKSGLFPSQNNSVQTVGVAMNPEKVWNYEVGAKTEWLNRRLRVNASAYWLDYQDLQQFGLTPGLVLVTFSLNAKIKGAEIEVLAAPTNWLTVGGNLAFIDSEVTKGVFNNVSLIGKELPKAPGQTRTVFAEVTQAMATGKFSGRVEYAHKDAYFNDPTNSAAGKFPAYGLLDARLTYAPTGDKLEFAVWGKNLRNTLYQQHVILFLNNGFSTFGAPRTIGASVNWKF